MGNRGSRSPLGSVEVGRNTRNRSAIPTTTERRRAPGWHPPAAVLAGLIAAVAIVAPAPALAAYGHADITAEFGSAGTPSSTFNEINSLAYQAANKRLYVLGESGIYGSSIPSGGTFTPLGGAFPLSTTRGGGNAALAVDNTSGATSNNIYQVPDANELLGWELSRGPPRQPLPDRHRRRDLRRGCRQRRPRLDRSLRELPRTRVRTKHRRGDRRNQCLRHDGATPARLPSTR